MTNLQDKPFALIGVSFLTHEPGVLAATMAREGLNWRSVEGSEVHRRWNSPPSPSYYLLDHEGVIRRKWMGNPGAKAIEAALVKLIQAAEEAARD